MRSSSLWVESFVFPLYWIIWTVNKDYLSYSFPIYITVIPFSHLMALTNFGSNLNSIGEGRPPYLVLDLSANVSKLSPLITILPVGLSYITLITERNVPFRPDLLKIFYLKWCAAFLNVLSASGKTITHYLLFHFLMRCITVIGLYVLSCPCLPRINSPWFEWMIFLLFCWLWLTCILLKIVAYIIIQVVKIQSPWWIFFFWFWGKVMLDS